ncbi:hypothetical protein [Thermincola ferriacetica]
MREEDFRPANKILLFLVYLGLALIMTYPLVLVLTTGITDDGGDARIFLWNYWWFKKALLELKTNPFVTEYIFYPQGINLTLHTVNLFNVIMVLLLEKVVHNTFLAHNLVVLLSMALAAYGAYRLVFYETGAGWGAVLGGIIYGFSPYFFSHLGGHFNLTSTQFIPFYVLYFLRTVREGHIKYRNAVIAGLFLTLTGLADYYYLIYLLLFSVFFLIYLHFKDRSFLWQVETWKKFFVLVATFSAGFSPVIYNTIMLMVKGENVPLEGWGGANNNVIDLLAFFVPQPFHPLFRETVKPLYALFSGHVVEGTGFLGYIPLGLALVAMVKMRKEEPRVRFWSMFLLIFMVLSMGLSLHVMGRFYITEIQGIKIGLPLPYVIIHYIPLLQNARVPSRFTVMTMLCLGVLAGYGFKKLSAFCKPAKAKAVAVLLALGIAFEFFPAPFPVTEPKVPEFYEWLGKQKKNFTVLELPMGWRDGFKMEGITLVDAQYYQTVHNKYLINGYVARYPAHKTDFYQKYPVVMDILRLEASADSFGQKAGPEEASRFVRDFNVRYIVFNKNCRIPALEDYVRRLFPMTPVYADDRIEAYRVER